MRSKVERQTVRVLYLTTGQLRSGGDWGLEGVDRVAVADQITAYLAQYTEYGGDSDSDIQIFIIP